MKTKQFLTLLAFFGISASVLFTACKKDKDDNPSENILKKSYFTADNATYQDAAFPDMSSSGDAPSIANLHGNPSILEGGSNPITIETSGNIKEILVGVKNVAGYYAVPATALKSTNEAAHLVVLFFSQKLEEETFTIVIALRDNNGLVSRHETINVTKITAGTGKLQKLHSALFLGR